MFVRVEFRVMNTRIFQLTPQIFEHLLLDQILIEAIGDTEVDYNGFHTGIHYDSELWQTN